MAQRVYHIPVNPAVVEIFADLVLGQNEADEQKAWARLGELSRGHRTACAASTATAKNLSRESFEGKKRGSDYNCYVGLRPYLITEREPGAAVEATRSLIAADAEQVLVQLQGQLDRVADVTGVVLAEPGIPHAGAQDPWCDLREPLEQVRKMRRAALGDGSYEIEVYKEQEIADGLQGYVLGGETEMKPLEGTELAETYGSHLGALFGRLSGLCEPTWWLGRNYWIGGVLLSTRVGLLGRMFGSRLHKMLQELLALTISPAQLFERLRVPGYEAGFSPFCPAYSTGLYFPAESIGSLLGVFTRYADVWRRNAASLTGYSDLDLDMLDQMIQESLLYACDQGYGVIEGDELVGGYGYR